MAVTDSGEKPVVMVVEDEWMVAETIRESLESAGFHVAKIVASGEAAIASAESIRPDVVVMDIQLRGELDGIAAAERIGASRPTPLVYLTASADAETVRRATATEVSGYVLKPFRIHQLVTAVRIAASRRHSAAGARTRQLEDGLRSLAAILEQLGASTGSNRAWWLDTREAAALTTRERQIVELLGDGARVASIADLLGVSRHTVRNHVKAIFRKTGVHSQQELIEWLRRSR